MTKPARSRPIIVGVGCRFPNGSDAGEFWHNLEEGSGHISQAPQERFEKLGLGDFPKFNGGFVAGIEHFDPGFFGISPREAAAMDPQQCIALETTAAALADAALAPNDLADLRVGVFAAASLHDYSVLRWSGQGDGFAVAGSANSAVANRVSYWLNARGPSVCFDTACSSSLSAAHFACQSLESGECDIAVVVGVSAILLPAVTQRLVEAGVVTTDAMVKTFGADASGYLRGEGGGAVILASQECAAKRDLRGYACIEAHALNHGGHSNGFAAPNPWAQADVIGQAYERSKLPIENLVYVEAMGASTRLGDQLELKSLANALATSPRPHPCAVGSLKPNIGHLEAASGMASLIKLSLGTYFQRVPAMRCVDELNPAFAKLKGQLALADQPTELQESDLVGINSFALGGSNAHLVLGAAGAFTKTPRQKSETDGREFSFCFSAATNTGLVSVASAFARAFRQRPDDIDDLIDKNVWSATYQSQRAAVIGVSVDDVADTLENAHNIRADASQPHISAAAAGRTKTDLMTRARAATQLFIDGSDDCLREHSQHRHRSDVWLPAYAYERTLDTTASLSRSLSFDSGNAQIDSLLEAIQSELEKRRR